LASNDLIFEATQGTSPEEERETILELFKAGLFSDEKGEVSIEVKQKILESFGFGGFENAKDISALHIAKASEENVDMLRDYAEVDSYDDHDLHVVEHTRFLLSDEFRKRKDSLMKQRFCEHIAEHEKKKKKAVMGLS
jgi:hypothetical protein